jgi:hypothetical protein
VVKRVYFETAIIGDWQATIEIHKAQQTNETSGQITRGFVREYYSRAAQAMNTEMKLSAVKLFLDQQVLLSVTFCSHKLRWKLYLYNVS